MMISTQDHPQEACGVIGVYAPQEDVVTMAYFGLHALQHRGQEAAGIAVYDGGDIRLHKDLGLVASVFTPWALERLQGRSNGRYAIGHTRYSTTGSSSLRNAQPFLVETRYGPLAVAHNGNLVNTARLRQDLLARGVGLSSTTDSEVIALMLAGAPGEDWESRLRSAMPSWQGAYSLVVLTPEGIFAVRDPWGFRPLSVGLLPGGGHAVASETGALQTLGCQAVREVAPGEVVRMAGQALRVFQALPPAPRQARCAFEHIYFSRPDSVFDGRSVHQVRQRLGEVLAREAPVLADVVIPVPDTSLPAAIGYARVSGLPYNEGFVKNRYIGRTFIQPTDSLRRMGVALKFNVLEENVRGRRLVVIDDSLVRGNTIGPLVRMLREAGAQEVHLRLTCPPIRHPCFMGVDMGTYGELIAHRLSVDEICTHIGCDSLAFLSLEGMLAAMDGAAIPEGVAPGDSPDSAAPRQLHYCNACFTGDYPIDVDFDLTKTGFEQIRE